MSTLERWLYAPKGGGVQALRPKSRGERGRWRKLTAEQCALLREIRIEHLAASAALIERTLEVDGRPDQGAV
ncbi:MAG: helix-turn-helix domain-containing protein [Deltaproteobacteria bacterium]|nr:helix-turn-helix domain-containing protein [Deltaproteobacteria bacterium]